MFIYRCSEDTWCRVKTLWCVHQVLFNIPVQDLPPIL